MKPFLVLGVINWLLFVSAAYSEPFTAPAITTINNAVLRRGPEKSSVLIALMPKGYLVYIEKKQNGYFKVETSHTWNHKTIVGWVPDWQLAKVSIKTANSIYQTPAVQKTDGSGFKIINPPSGPTLPSSSPSDGKQSYQISPALGYDNYISFINTRNQWYKVQASGGYVHFRGAAYTQGKFSANLAINGAFFAPTSKPITVNLSVTLFDAKGNVVGREQDTVYSVADTGGEYTLIGEYSDITPDPVACSIQYNGAWTSKK